MCMRLNKIVPHFYLAKISWHITNPICSTVRTFSSTLQTEQLENKMIKTQLLIYAIIYIW